MLVNLLQEGVEHGDLPPTTDPELLADAGVGPIVIRRLMMNRHAIRAWCRHWSTRSCPRHRPSRRSVEALRRSERRRRNA